MKDSILRRFGLLRQLFKSEKPKVRRRRMYGCIWRIAPTGDGVSHDGDCDVVRIAPSPRQGGGRLD